jgi:SpoIID/LytB domain protein
MSQYGARGAAKAGLTSTQIVAFYYPGTRLGVPSSNRAIRVQISGTGGTTVFAAEPGLSVTGVGGALPTAGIDKWQLLAAGSGHLLRKHVAAGWLPYAAITAARADVRDSDGLVRIFRGSSSMELRGVVSAVRSGGGSITVNALSLDDYTRAVVPREMPSSWQPAAVQAQAIAARSYGRYYVEHPRSSLYDICDTTSCQVYGGWSGESSGGNAAVGLTANKVLTYGGATIFAEFSASNGGMTSSGNKPYFVTKRDPYNNAGTGDPYLNWTDTVSIADVARYYGLARVNQIRIATREGGGEWGGLVGTVYVDGLRSNLSAATVQTTGASLASAMGSSYRYFRIVSAAPNGHLESVTKSGLHTVNVRGWTFDPANSAASNLVQINVDGVSKGRKAASLPRADVRTTFRTASANHGFIVQAWVPGGNHQVCAYGIGLNGVENRFLGCKMVSVPIKPIGTVESVTAMGQGRFRLIGWTFDPDRNGGPGRLHVYVDRGGRPFDGWLHRADVKRHYGLGNDQVGFNVTVTVPPGRHKICAYGINVAGSPVANSTLRCVMVTR